MLLGYNTNGFAHHRLEDAIAILADIGYRSVALTIDQTLLNPYQRGLPAEIDRVSSLLDRYQMRSVIETGARYLLDPRHKHEPTLMTADPAERSRRVTFYRHAIDIAAELHSDCVSLWSGVLKEELAEGDAFGRLEQGLRLVMEYAEHRGVTFGFEPEPGMFIDTMTRYQQLIGCLDSPLFRLTLDIGHLHCQGEIPIADQIRRWGSRVVNVHIEDMRAGVHEHLMFGDGEVDFSPILAALREIGYTSGVHVELSRHSHMAPEAARRAFECVSPLIRQVGDP
jgi:L-ribulose-5-phosphate 3-epimerase